MERTPAIKPACDAVTDKIHIAFFIAFSVVGIIVVSTYVRPKADCSAMLADFELYDHGTLVASAKNVDLVEAPGGCAIAE